jgi:Ca2+-binding RTX toxin-like protein
VFLGLVMLLATNISSGQPNVRRPAPFRASIDARRTLRILGTDEAESIVAQVRAEGATIEIEYRRADGTEKPQTVSFPLDAFDRLEVSSGGGADFVNIIDPAETLDARKKVLSLDGGEGDNVVVISHLPFQPDTAARIRKLLDLSGQLEELAKRAGDATTAVLAGDLIKHADAIRVGVVDESKAIAADAEKQVLTPANELVERQASQIIEQAKSILARADEIENRHAKLVVELTKQLDPTNGVFPRDDNREPDAAHPVPAAEERPEPEAPPEGARLAQAALALGDEAQAQLERWGAQIQSDADGIEKRAGEIEKRAERLSGAADRLAADAEKELTASSDRAIAVVGELRSLTAKLQEAGLAVGEEIKRAASIESAHGPIARLTAQQAAGANCGAVIVTMHSYTGGSGFDFFLPLGAPSSSWSINGGNGFNILFGGFAADVIQGGSGTDWIFGLKGDDQIHGGDGTDFLFGEFLIDFPFLTGNDCIWGDGGVDLVVGDSFSNSFGASRGDDTLFGGAGSDFAFGDDVLDIFNDTLPGGSDKIEGNDGIDFLFGCGGNDEIHGNDDIDLAIGNGGNDKIWGDNGRNVTILGTVVHIGNLLLGSPGDDEVHGGKGVDLIFGNDGDDKLYGGDQLDVLFGGRGKDEMHGEAGGVVFTINNVPVRLGNLMFGGTEDDKMWGGGDLDVMFGQDGNDEVRGFEAPIQPLGIDADVLFGNAGDDYLEGDDENPLLMNSTDFMFGGPGDDKMAGGSQSDFMFGGTGRDTMDGDSGSLLLVASVDLMFGGPGDDTMNGGNSLDVMFGGDDNDTMKGDSETPLLVSPDFMFGGPGDDNMNGGVSIDFMFGGPGADRMLGDSNLAFEPLSIDFMFGNDGPDDMDGGNGIDFMFGGPGCDRMIGDNSIPGRISPDFMFGGAGDDTMDGGVNTDFMWGNDGNDTMIGDIGLSWMVASVDFMWGNDGCDTMSGGRAADFIWGGAGVDRMDGQWGPDVMFGGAGGDTINGGDSLDLIWGDDGNDLIHGDSGPDVIIGGDGDDCLYGDDGPDLILGGNGKDCLHGGDGPDILLGGDGDDRLFGDSGWDALFGGAGDDKLDGGSGADFMTGGPGNDELWGGPGLDIMFGETKHQSGSSGLDCQCKAEVCTGTICVKKFNDLNGNGVQNTGEAGLPNWAFQVTCGCVSTQLTTDAGGNACGTFFPGPCTVVEMQQAGWSPTTQTTQTATVSSGQAASVTFGNRKPPGQPCVLDPGMVAASNTFARRPTALAQTFTPSQSGSLTQITHGLQSISTITNYDLLITRTDSGTGRPKWSGGPYTGPDVLYSATGLTVFSTSGIVNGVVPITAGPALSSGTLYALVIVPGSPASGDMAWRGNSSAGSYPAGSAYELNGTVWSVPTVGPKDHGFKLNGTCP